MIIPQPRPIILVTGANGQLGQEFRYLASQQEDYEFLFTTRDTLDITETADINLILSKWKPQYCINCAAYTAVDKAEEDEEKAFLINSIGVKTFAEACKKYECKLIHISTDYVYDSITDRPILSSDICTPRSVYGKSKLTGDQAILDSGCKGLSVRVSWLYSSYAANFVKTMLRLGRDRDELTIVADQIGAPTYARDLANSILSIINLDLKEEINWGRIYNYSNTGQTNWADFAREIFRQSNISCQVKNTTTADYGAPAPRPLWSVMDTSAITSDFGLKISSWENALKRCLAVLAGQE